MACRMMSSRLGLVAEVIATESPSQLSPVVIQRTCAVTPSVFCCSLYGLAVVAIASPRQFSTDPRQGISDQLVHDPPAAKARLHKHHPGRLGAHLADLGRRLTALDGSQSLERPVRRLGRDERDQLAFVGHVHRIDPEY